MYRIVAAENEEGVIEEVCGVPTDFDLVAGGRQAQGLHEDVATGDGNASVYGVWVARWIKPRPLMQARFGVPLLHRANQILPAGKNKHRLFSDKRRFNLSADFGDLREWLDSPYLAFRKGKCGKEANEDGGMEGTSGFDEETLGGCIRYSALTNPVPALKGKLKGLVIRYSPSPSTSAG